MKLLKLLSLLAVFFCLAATKLSAQNVSGKLLDEQGNPLPYANIVMLALPDSAFVAGTVSDDNGAFILQPCDGRKLLRISSIGYTTVYRNCEGPDMGVIQLETDAQMLGEVVVKGDLPKTRLKGDAMITGVAGTVLENVGTAENLLDKIPGVSAEEGSVNVFGRGEPEIYINGRKVRDNSELDQLASDNIKSVEVVKNPGARYAASVKSVIRIVTKKALGDGFGFNNRFSTRYRYKWTVLDQFNFNYRKGGFDLSGMLFGYDGHMGEDKAVYQNTYLDKHWNQSSTLTGRGREQDLSGMLSMNYQLSENHVMGIRYDYDRTPKDGYTLYMPTTVTQDRQLYEESVSSSGMDKRATDQRLNIYYSGKVNDWSIDFNADGLWNKNNTSSLADESTRYVDGTSDQRYVSTFSRKENTLYAAKLVFSHSLLGGDLSFGGEYSHTARTNVYLNPEEILDDDDSKIEEGDLAAFAEYSRSFGDVNVQAGVRYEYVNFDYYEYGKRMDEQSKEYNNVFPSVAVSFPIGKVQMQLSYAVDIRRPSYEELRGNVTYINRYTYESGNPFLDPTLTQNFMLNSSYKWAQLSVGYQHIKDGITNYTQAYSEEDPTIALVGLVNLQEYDKAFASLTLSPTIGIWTPQFSAQVEKQWYTADTPEGPRKLDNPMGSFSWKNNLKLPAGFLLDVDAAITTRGYDGNAGYTRKSWRTDISLFKGFMNDRLSCQFQVTDLFQTRKNWIRMYCGIRTVDVNMDPKRGFNLTVRYKFNSGKSKYKGTGAGSSQKSRM